MKVEQIPMEYKKIGVEVKHIEKVLKAKTFEEAKATWRQVVKDLSIEGVNDRQNIFHLFKGMATLEAVKADATLSLQIFALIKSCMGKGNTQPHHVTTMFATIIANRKHKPKTTGSKAAKAATVSKAAGKADNANTSTVDSNVVNQ